MSTKIELYKILWEQLNGELSRFWSRFNVLLGIQLAFVVTLFKPMIENQNKDTVLWAVYLFLTVLSGVTLAIVNRAIKTYEFTFQAIMKFEKENKDNGINLITDLATGIKKNSHEKFVDLSNPMAYKFARIIPVITGIVWSILFIFTIYNLIEGISKVQT